MCHPLMVYAPYPTTCRVSGLKFPKRISLPSKMFVGSKKLVLFGHLTAPSVNYQTPDYHTRAVYIMLPEGSF